MGKENLINVYDQEMSFRQIHNDFAQTKEGQRLKANVRYPRYKGELSNDEWQKLVGKCDLNNLDHNRYTYFIAGIFIKDLNNSESKMKVNEEEAEIIKIAAEIHDWPEGFTKKGDVCYEVKTKVDEDNEIEVIEKILTEMFPENRKKREEIRTTLEDKKSKLGKIFNAIENIGYIKTATTAWKRKANVDEKMAINLTWLTENVLSNTIDNLINHSQDYPPFRKFIESKKDIISEAFNNIPESNFDNYVPEERKKAKNKYERAAEKWKNWIIKSK